MPKTKKKAEEPAKKPTSQNQLILKVTAILLALPTIVLLSYLAFLAFFYQHIYPGIKVASTPVGGQSPVEAHQKLAENFKQRAEHPLKLTYQGQTFTINVSSASPEINVGQQIKMAYNIGRSGNYLEDLKQQIKAIIFGLTFSPQISYKKEAALTQQLEEVNLSLYKEPINAQVSLNEEITVTPSSQGQQLDKGLLQKQINDYLSLQTEAPTSLPVKTKAPNFTTATAEKYQQALQSLKNNPLKLTYESQSLTIDRNSLYELLDFKDATSSANSPQITLNQEKLTAFLSTISLKVNQEAQDAKFTVESPSGGGSLKVKEFQQAQEGRKVDLDQTTNLVIKALSSEGSREITLPVAITQPTITNADVNNLGINTKIAQGVSHFTGSITNRIYNIGLAASRINGILVPPGETFSFLHEVGDISGKSGYKPAYIIKDGRTVLDDGGGVCQVSTTVFRAALNAGVPITERTAHAYRVTYYEQGGFQPGLDATVFSPSVDLKFKNDTPAYILIQAYVSDNSLYVDLYGTDDGRIASITTPKILSQTPPLPEIRQDDPALPKGTIKQVDWPAWGAKVIFSRTVKRGGEELINETFNSNYRSWPAVYLVGTKEP